MGFYEPVNKMLYQHRAKNAPASSFRLQQAMLPSRFPTCAGMPGLTFRISHDETRIYDVVAFSVVSYRGLAQKSVVVCSRWKVKLTCSIALFKPEF